MTKRGWIIIAGFGADVAAEAASEAGEVPAEAAAAAGVGNSAI